MNKTGMNKTAMNKTELMQYCITLAEQAGVHNEVPVAAVIADRQGQYYHPSAK